MEPNFITIWYHSCKRGHGKDQTSARSWDTEQRDAVHIPILPSEVKHLSCRVLEHLCLREQPRFPSRSGVFTQVGCVLPSLHCTSAQPQVEALCWRAGQTDEVSISLYVVPLFQGTALILSHYSVRMHVRKGHQPLPQSRSAGSMWICSFSHCLHTLLQKESTNTCTMQSK